MGAKREREHNSLDALQGLLIIASAICSVVLLSVWNKNDFSQNLNTVTALMVICLGSVCITIWNDAIISTDYATVIATLIFSGIPLALSAYIVSTLRQLKDQPQNEQIRVMQETNINQMYKAAASLPIILIVLNWMTIGMIAMAK